MIENAPRGCALRAEEDGCCRSRAPARESGLPDSLFLKGCPVNDNQKSREEGRYEREVRAD